MEEKQEKEKTKVFDKICEQVDKKLEALTNEGIQQTNIDYLGKLIDVKKDISKINHTEMEEEMMYREYDNYGNYDGYGRDSYGRDNYGTYNGGRRRDSRGRYMEGGRGNYGRRYRGDDMMEDMAENYGRYMESHESGNYGGPETSKSFDYMLKSAKDFFKHLKDEAGSQEEIEKIRRTAREISEM